MVDTNILSTFAKIRRLEILFKIMGRDQLYVSNSVLHELDMAKSLGYDFVQNIFGYIDIKKISILSMNDEEKDFYLELPNSFGEGERESVAISKYRSHIFVSNEKRVKNYCDRNNIYIVDLPTLLRRAWKTGLIEKEIVRKMVEMIEEKDNIIFKNKSIIFEE